MKTFLIPGLLLVSCSGLFAQPILLKDIEPGSGSSSSDYLTSYNTEVFFRAYNSASNQSVLYKTDGTAGGTLLVKDIPVSVEYPQKEFMVFSNKLFFTAYTPGEGFELWVSNGTTAGTNILKDIIPGQGSSSPSYFTNAGSVLYFQAFNSSGDPEIWKTDGTEAGTSLVSQINPAISNKPPDFTFANGLLFFRSETDKGDELWRSDGTAAGTFMLMDIDPGPGSGLSELIDITAFKNEIYFAADDGVHGEELWKSDGSLAGTMMISDISGVGGSNPGQFTPANDFLYFTAEHDVLGQELFKTDGTATGTQLLRDIAPGEEGSYPEGLVASGNELYFQAYDPVHGMELWKSDGSHHGTNILADVNPTVTGAFNSPESSRPSNITTVGEWIYFTADKAPFSDNELWVIHRSGKGLRMVADIRAGSLSSFPSNLKAVGNSLYFSANNGTNGFELWLEKAATNKINDFTLIDAVSDANLHTLTANEFINLAALPHKAINIRANGILNPGGSVVFELNSSQFRTENIAPYALAGDNPKGNYRHWNPVPGHYQLCATPYSGPSGTGIPGVPACLEFDIVDVSFGITHLTLINTDNGQEITQLRVDALGVFNLQEIDVSHLQNPSRLSIRANTYPANMDLVGFGLNGDDYGHQETQAPYSLFGDNNGTYNAWQDVLPRRIDGEHYLEINAMLGTREATAASYFSFLYDPVVSYYTLVNAETDTDIGLLKDGDIIDLSALPTRKLNIRANPVPGTAGSVLFDFSRASTFPPIPYNPYDNQAPYTVFGDINGDYNEWIAEPGFYHLDARVSSLAQSGSGEALGMIGNPNSISFQLVDTASGCDELSVYAVTIVDAKTGNFIDTLRENYAIDKSTIGEFSFEAHTCGGNTGSVSFSLDGSTNHTENVPPYALLGNFSPAFPGYAFVPWNANTGNHFLWAVPFIYPNGKGYSGNLLFLNFQVIESVTAKRATDTASPSEVVAALDIFPNPATGVFNISLGVKQEQPALMQISDLKGRKIYQEYLFPVNGVLQKQLDLSKHSNGIYFLQLKTDTELYTAKLLLHHPGQH